jgi:hypothetical protein
VDLGHFFNFLIYTQSVGLLGPGISLLQGRYLHTEQHKHRKNADIHAASGIRAQDPSVRVAEDGSFLDPAATVIGREIYKLMKKGQI